jgi:hypothetical protein
MSDVTQEELVRIAHQYYPRGFPPEEDDPREPTPAHHRTPEHQRFMAAWEHALRWEAWGTFMEELRSTFPNYGIGGGTQPFVSACLRCQIYKTEPQRDGDQLVTRVAAAVSVLAPLYVVYATTQRWHPQPQQERSHAATVNPAFRLRRSSPPHLTFEPPSDLKPQAAALANLVERVLECRPFPLQLARVPLPGIRIGQLNILSSDPPPTLLDALFSDDLANLP